MRSNYYSLFVRILISRAAKFVFVVKKLSMLSNEKIIYNNRRTMKNGITTEYYVYILFDSLDVIIKYIIGIFILIKKKTFNMSLPTLISLCGTIL